MGQFCDVLQLEMPKSFPLAEFETFVDTLRRVTDPYSDARKESNGALNLIGWRFRAFCEYKDSYLDSWHRIGANASFEELYLREKAFFGMFVCGVSTIESACYACYALASDPSLLNLSFDERIRRHKSKPRNLLKKLDKVQPDHQLTRALQWGLGSAEWEVYRTYRNTMTHRSNIPRIIHGAIGSAPPPEKIMQFADTWRTKGMHAGEDEFEKLFEWLTFFLRDILLGGEALGNLALTSSSS